MKKTISYSAVALLLCSALVLSGCNMITNLFGGDVPTTTTQKTLAEQVVDELVANLSASSKAMTSKAVTFTTTEINQIKTKALERIAQDGYTNSQYVDEIIPSMVLGVGNAVSEIATTDNEKKSALLQVTAKSSIQSMAKSERSNNFKKDKKEAVASVAVKVIQVVQSQGGSDTAIALAVSKEFSATVITSFADTSDAMLETVTKTVTSEVSDTTVIGIVVQGTISAVVEDTTDSSKQQALVQATISGAMEAAQYSSNASDIAVEIVNDSATALSGNTDLLSTAVGTALVMADEVGVPIDTNSLGQEVQSTVNEVITAIESEPDPVFGNVTANGQSSLTLTQAGTVTLSVDVNVDDASKYTYKWTQVSGPEVTITNASSQNASVSITANGEYEFKVTVTNKDGYKFAAKTCKVFVSITSSTSATLVTEGLNALKNKNFDLAYTKFQAAYAKDPNNTDALFWGALLNISAIGTDSATVDLFRNRIGMASYPATMNELFSTTWFNGNYYNTKYGFYPAPADADYYYIRGRIDFTDTYSDVSYGKESEDGWISWGYTQGRFIPDENGEYYSNYYMIYDANDTSVTNHYYSSSITSETEDTYTNNGITYHSIWSPLPASAKPYTYGRILDLTNPVLLPKLEVPAWSTNMFKKDYVYGSDADHIAGYDYSLLLMLNIIQRNPNGLNALIDSVLNGVFGSRLTQALAMIDALPDNAAVAIPNELFVAFAGSEPPTTEPIKINKAELKAFAASVQVLKSFVQLIASYNLNYPIGFLQFDWTSETEATTALDKLLAQQNPIAYGFMGNRSDSMRSAAKQTMISALSDADKAIEIILNNWNDEAYISGMTGGFMTNWGPDADIYKVYLNDGRSLLQDVKTALNENRTLYVNPNAINGGSVAELLSIDSASGGIPFNLSVLYSKDVLNPAKLLEVKEDSAGQVTGLKLYGLTSTGNWEELQYGGTYADVAFGVNYSYYQDLFPMPGTDITSPQGNGNYLVPAGSAPNSGDTTSWELLNWIQGKK